MKYSNEDKEGCHRFLDHNPLKSSSSYDLHQPIDYSELELFDNPLSNEANLMSYNTDDSNLSIDSEYDLDTTNYYNKWSESEKLLSTAVSKLQIKLNNLINNHKASIKMYDDIVQLFNNYLSSPNLDPHAKLKSRISFIISMKSSYLLSPLRPPKKEVRRHDGDSVSVPLFDAKAMILDLLTNPNLMKTNNLAKGYDVLTGNVDDNLM
jgi:hypothetical protein